ncbi:MAG: dihydroorotate dehydrogenase electron transfer subunit [Spirochaetes bacterium]|nr:dihydroorotate dehydrogenase electron transfer subunit [Spirochaetota bacterium]
MNTPAQLIETTCPLVKIEGNPLIKTLYFEIGQQEITPGQFYMLNYQNQQKPFSISYYDQQIIGFTILDRGPVSKKMLTTQIGNYFGLTGPLGNGFKIIPEQRYLLIGGGCGAAPIYFLANQLLKNEIEFDILLGAQTRSILSFADSLKSLTNQQVYFYTDDNTGENQGFVTNGLEHLDLNQYQTCCLCGPEIMMLNALKKVDHIAQIQISMERYMKCGLGICGSCVIDQTGQRICREGPVLDYKELKKSHEFGHYHRNSGGMIEQI